MLEGLDEIDWKNVRHLYGSAEDVPIILRRLAVNDREAFDHEGLGLFSYGQEMGAIHESTPLILPFAIELLTYPQIERKDLLLDGLESVFCRAPVSHETMLVARKYLQVYDIFLRHINVFKQLLSSDESRIRGLVIEILTGFDDELDDVREALQVHFHEEVDDKIKVLLLNRLSSLVLRTRMAKYEHTVAFRSSFFDFLNEILASDQHSNVKLAAAIAAANLGIPDQISSQTKTILVDALTEPINIDRQAKLETYIDEYILALQKHEIARSLLRIDRDSLQEILKRGSLQPKIAHLVARELLDSRFSRIKRDGAWESYRPPLNYFGDNEWSYGNQAEYQIGASGVLPDESPSLWHHQIEPLKAILDNDAFWKIPTNLFSFFYGLPVSREELRKLIEQS